MIQPVQRKRGLGTDGCFPEREERAGWVNMFHYGGNGLLSTYPAAMENTEWLVREWVGAV